MCIYMKRFPWQGSDKPREKRQHGHQVLWLPLINPFQHWNWNLKICWFFKLFRKVIMTSLLTQNWIKCSMTVSLIKKWFGPSLAPMPFTPSMPYCTDDHKKQIWNRSTNSNTLHQGNVMFSQWAPEPSGAPNSRFFGEITTEPLSQHCYTFIALCKTVVSPLLIQCRYCSLVPRHC